MKLFPVETLPTPIHINIVSSSPGRIRLRVSRQHREDQAMAEIASALKEFFSQIHEVRTNVQTGSITVYYTGEIGSFDEALTNLRDLGIIALDMPTGKPQAGAPRAMANLNQQLKRATNNSVDLRSLVLLGLSAIALRQILSKGSQLKAAPLYVLAWYVLDSLIAQLNKSKPPPASDQPPEPK